MTRRITLLLIAFLLVPVARAEDLVPSECLIIRPVGRYGRSPVHRDALEAEIVTGKWRSPMAGDTVKLPDGTTQTWEKLKAARDGFQHEALRGGYAYVPVTVEKDEVRILEASGHGMVYVNGEPRAGDSYETGWVHVPVALKKGVNQLLFHCGRGNLRLKLTTPKAPQVLDLVDTTLPDLLVGQTTETAGALLVLNATAQPVTGLTLVVAKGPQTTENRTEVPPLLPCSTRKVMFSLVGPEPKEAGEAPVKIELRQGDRLLDTATFKLRVRKPTESRKYTFISTIDGSVQYYAVQPAQPVGQECGRAALFLTLHGASVEALGQADAYASKSWGCIVAPTNRRPYGFDWEDWGRLDALEVLGQARARLDTDPQRTYLTGHSMGGHGTWHLGLTYPDHWAAIGPSAGWISMYSYAGMRRPEAPTGLQETFLRAAAPSDTLALQRNTLAVGVYILHGDKDDNVPVDQARQMRDHLSKFHHDLEYHEQPGAGHWWGAGDEPGAACVDWAPMFDFFGRHAIPCNDAVRQVEFATMNPGVSAWCYWAGIEAQQQPGKVSTISLRHDPWKRRFSGKTENVARLALDLRHVRPRLPLTVELDGQKVEIAWPEEGKQVWLTREGDKWSATPEPSAALKGPLRSGPFKDAFRNNMLFVYGTHGSAEENAWALAKARFDAETFWYRGNGSVDVVSDTEFSAAKSPKLKEPDRNVILYGNADTNGAWAALLGDSPVQVHRGKVHVGEREEKGEDLACLFLRPRPKSVRACVGIVAGTGLAGMRLTDRVPYFVSGIGYPDYCVLGPESLSKGVEGVRLAGFFGNDWGVKASEPAGKR